MGNFNHNYEIYKKYTIDEIYSNLNQNILPDKILYNEKDYKDSLKRCKILKDLITRDGNFCKQCNKIPEYFALGKDNSNRWHLDLYGVYNNDIYMFTIDHIYPKSKGGENKLENYQLLCKPCNEFKSDYVEGENNNIFKKTINSKYLNNKLYSLNQQIKGVLLKIKNHKLICIKKQKNFTIGKEYDIVDIKVKINNKFDTEYNVFIKNDDDIIIKTKFNNFITKRDYDS